LEDSFTQMVLYPF